MYLPISDRIALLPKNITLHYLRSLPLLLVKVRLGSCADKTDSFTFVLLDYIESTFSNLA